MKKDYQPKECPICGMTFIPKRFNQVTCGADKCKYKWKHRNSAKRNAMRNRARKDGYRHGERHTPKPDTIVAIGYAERQRAKTLSMVGKIDTTL